MGTDVDTNVYSGGYVAYEDELDDPTRQDDGAEDMNGAGLWCSRPAGGVTNGPGVETLFT